jgi:prepilin-type N-terminal cleavage/methylation domain-containing protein
MKFKSAQKGFTLIELLVVIGILAVLLAITLIAINPAKQFQQANDTKRRSDVSAILNAVNQYMSDNSGTVPTGITTTVQNVASTGADICSQLVPEYLAALPRDPLTVSGADVTDCTTAHDTGYTIVEGSSNRITVNAPAYEGSSAITVTR